MHILGFKAIFDHTDNVYFCISSEIALFQLFEMLSHHKSNMII